MPSQAGFRGPLPWTYDQDRDQWTRNYRYQCRLTVAHVPGAVWEICVEDWAGDWSLPPTLHAGFTAERAQRLAELIADAKLGPHDSEEGSTHEYLFVQHRGATTRWWARAHAVIDGAFVLLLGHEQEAFVLDTWDIESVQQDGKRVFPEGK